MPRPLPLVPQADKPYDLINLEQWNRADSFSFFMAAGTQLHMSASVPFETMTAYLTENKLRRFSTVLYLLWRCANEIEAFRISALHHPEENDPRTSVLFGELDICFPVLDADGIPKNVLVALDSCFEESYRRIVEAIDEVRAGVRDNMFADGHPCLLVSNVPYPFDDIEMTSVHKHMLIPSVIVGSPRLREGAPVLPVALSFHHAFADGMDLIAFFKTLEGYFENPGEVLG